MRSRRNLTRADRLGYVIGGVALLVWALRRPGMARAAAAGAGGWLLYQGYTGRNPMFRPLGIEVNPHPALAEIAETLVVEEAITISRPRADVYGFFCERGRLPALDETDVELMRDVPMEEIAWRAKRGERLAHFGSVTLRDAPGGRGTIVAARVEYAPSGGSLGAVLACVAGRSPQRLVADGLRQARALLETGEIPTTCGQSTGRR